jgi:hypothetical protein
MLSSNRFSRNLMGAFLLACAFCSNASATDFTVGDLTDKSYAHSATFNSIVNPAIEDVFYFSVAAPATFNAIASEVVMASFFNISNFSMELAAVSTVPSLFSQSGVVIQTGNLTLPQGGQFKVTVRGNIDGSFGGAYSLLMTAASTQSPGPQTASPVPEPEQWLMLLLGGALLVARRRA